MIQTYIVRYWLIFQGCPSLHSCKNHKVWWRGRRDLALRGNEAELVGDEGRHIDLLVHGYKFTHSACIGKLVLARDRSLAVIIPFPFPSHFSSSKRTSLQEGRHTAWERSKMQKGVISQDRISSVIQSAFISLQHSAAEVIFIIENKDLSLRLRPKAFQGE